MPKRPLPTDLWGGMVMGPMQRWLCVVLAVFAVGGLAACGSSGGGDDAGVSDDEGERVETVPSLAEVLMNAVLDGELEELPAVTAGMEVVAGQTDGAAVTDVEFSDVDDHMMTRWANAVEEETGDTALDALLDETTLSLDDIEAASVGVVDATLGNPPEFTGDDESALGATGDEGVVPAGLVDVPHDRVAQPAQRCPAQLPGSGGCVQGARYELQGVEVVVWHHVGSPGAPETTDQVAGQVDAALSWIGEFLVMPTRIDVITANEVSDDGDLGVAWPGGTRGDCVMALTDRSLSDDAHLGTVAHEVMHCFQGVNYQSPYGPATTWWYEGGPEWVGGQVVGSVTSDMLGSVALGDISRNLTRQAFSAWPFFSFVSDVASNPAAVFDLWEMIDARGGDQAALAGVSGIDDVWTEYVKAWFDGTIPAFGGGTIETRFPATLQEELRESGDSVSATVEAFAAHSIDVQVEDVSSDDEIELVVEASALPGAYFAESNWEEIPGGAGTWTLTGPGDPYATNTIALIGNPDGAQSATASLDPEDEYYFDLLTGFYEVPGGGVGPSIEGNLDYCYSRYAEMFDYYGGVYRTLKKENEDGYWSSTSRDLDFRFEDQYNPDNAGLGEGRCWVTTDPIPGLEEAEAPSGEPGPAPAPAPAPGGPG